MTTKATSSPCLCCSRPTTLTGVMRVDPPSRPEFGGHREIVYSICSHCLAVTPIELIEDQLARAAREMSRVGVREFRRRYPKPTV